MFVLSTDTVRTQHSREWQDDETTSYAFARFLHEPLAPMAPPSGIQELGSLAPGSHVGQLYRDAQDLLDTLVPFFATGLAQHERCIWVTAPPLAAALARPALAAAVEDLARYERTSQIELIELDAWHTGNGALDPDEVIQRWLDAEAQALADGYRGLRISASTSSLVPGQWQACAEYEARVHAAVHGRNIVALCSYSLAQCHSHEVVDVLHNHTVSLIRADQGWSVVHGATAALASLDVDNAVDSISTTGFETARSAREQLVRLERLAAALGEVTTRLALVDVVSDLVATTLDVAGIVIVESGEDGSEPLLVAHGIGVDVMRPLAESGNGRVLWSSDGATRDSVSPLRAIATIPLDARGRRLGMCVLGFATPRPFSASYRALAQDVVRQVALALDRSRTYERLDHERKRAELASRAKDEFLAMLGHELRNPLSPILTATQLMRLRGADALEHERVVIERQVKHMIRLVDDLLDVSRITRGKVELRRCAVELSEILTQAAELASPALEERAHRFRLEMPEAGVVVHADPQRLAQVVSNLLSNAAKYTPAGGDIQVEVGAARSTVSIVVRDNGIGIDSALLPNVFDMFVQGRQGIDRASGGLGLGLAITKSLVELHGGTIRVHSAGLGTGTEFTIELPRYANTRPSTRNSMSGFPVPPVRGRRVLVVDDNEDAAFLFSEALRRLGHHVDVAHDGPSAIACARERPPEIAFLDIGLPVMDGYELGRRLRELCGTPPRLVALTGYGRTSDRERSRDAGFDLHLVKPIELSVVQDALAKLE